MTVEYPVEFTFSYEIPGRGYLFSLTWDGECLFLRELAQELGNEVYSLLVSAQRDWTIEHIELLGKTRAMKGMELKEALRSYLEDLPIFGYGNPVSLKAAGPEIEIVIENPFNEDFLAGILQGLYQEYSGRKSVVSCKETAKATASFVIKTADSK